MPTKSKAVKMAIPKGWRKLRIGEVVRASDKVLNTANHWQETICAGCKHGEYKTDAIRIRRQPRSRKKVGKVVFSKIMWARNIGDNRMPDLYSAAAKLGLDQRTFTKVKVVITTAT